MYKTATIISTLAAITIAADISSSYSLTEKAVPFIPDLHTGIDTHATIKKENHDEPHPVYKENEARASIVPVRPTSSIVNHDMLADEPEPTRVNVNRVDTIPGYGYVPGAVAYPDVSYAPGYAYDNGYAPSNNYDVYGPNIYAVEPTLSNLLWSQVPDSRTITTFLGNTAAWFMNSILVFLIGSIMTVGLCTYTNLCKLTFNGIGTIQEEMRSFVSPERLEKISTAANFVKTAIDKYQKIQNVASVNAQRKRRAVFY